MNSKFPILLIFAFLTVTEICAYGNRERCPICPALENCEIVICQTFVHEAKWIPASEQNCELFCNDKEVVCKQTYNGSLQWHPFNPCAITTTTTTTTTTTVRPTTTTTTTTKPVNSIKSNPFSAAPSRRVQTPFHFDNTTAILTSVDQPRRKKSEQTYGLSWLVSEPELEIVLWIMFSVALILMSLGIVGIFLFLWYRKRLKKQLKIKSSYRFYDENQSRGYDVVAYESAPYENGVEYEQLKHKSEYCVHHPGSHNAVGLPSNTHNFCQKCVGYQRRFSNFSEDQYYPGCQVIQAAYGSSTDGDPYAPVLNSTYQLVTFTPSLDTPKLGSVRIREPELHDYIEEIPFLSSTCSEPLTECTGVCRPVPPNGDYQINYAMPEHSPCLNSCHGISHLTNIA